MRRRSFAYEPTIIIIRILSGNPGMTGIKNRCVEFCRNVLGIRARNHVAVPANLICSPLLMYLPLNSLLTANGWASAIGYVLVDAIMVDFVHTVIGMNQTTGDISILRGLIFPT